MNTFSALLDTLNSATPARRPEVEQTILDTFQRRKAVLALDMSGFTLTVRREGILSYLCQVRRMHRLSEPIVLAHHGMVVKNEADNLLAVFDSPEQAVLAALAMVAAAAQPQPSGVVAIAFSVGIDCGDILLIDQVDCFGDAVNLAYKLGEDIARPGEVLVTQRMRDQLRDDGSWQLQEMTVSVSGLELVAYAVSRGTTDGSPAV